MTQPEKREGTVTWFWYLACMMFSERGRYTTALQERHVDPQGNEDSQYRPQRFVHAGHWTRGEIAHHFYWCGLQTKDANTLFHDYTNHWLGKLDSPPQEPDWSRVPAPRNHETRLNVNQRKRRGKKQRRPVGDSTPGEWPDPPVPPQYDELPPYGKPPPEGGSSAAPDPPADEDPDNFEDDPSRM